MSHIVDRKTENYKKLFIVNFHQNPRKRSILEMVRFFLRSSFREKCFITDHPFQFEIWNTLTFAELRPCRATKLSHCTKTSSPRATIAHLSPMCQGQISFQKTYKWATETRGPKSNSSELLCLSWLTATLMMIRSKLNG